MEEQIIREDSDTKKEAINIVELLLGVDSGKIKLPVTQVEITRLSEVFGKPFVLNCQALTPDKYEEVQNMALKVSGKDMSVDVSQLQIFTVMEGVIDADGKPLFKNKELREKFKTATPLDLIRKILLSGEIVSIYTEIAKLSGFGDDAVKSVKN